MSFTNRDAKHSPFKPYPAYKDSGIEWIGKIPEHWDIKPLKHTSKINDEVLPESFNGNNDISYIDISNVTLGKLINIPSKLKFKDAPSRARRIVKSGDTLVSTVRTYLKAITHISFAKENLIASTGFAVLTPKIITPKFLFYYSVSQKFIDRVCAKSVGVSYPAITSSEIGNIPIWFPPPLPEQTAIANFLDHKTAQIDAAIEKHRQLIELLQEQRAAIINEAVTKGINPNAPMKDSGIEWIGEIPEGWEIDKLKRFMNTITNGYVGPTRDILKDKGIKYIQSLHIKENTIKFHKPYFVSEEWSNKHSRSMLKEGDLLVVQTGAGTGNIGLVPKKFEGCNCHALIILRSNQKKIKGKYLLNFLLSNYGFHKLKSVETGALHPHLNATIICDIHIIVPPLREQQQIVDYIESETTRIDKEIDLAQQEIKLLEEYRQALIAEAVTRKIDVRDYPLN